MRNWGEPSANTVSHVCCADYWVRFGKACNHKELAVTAIEGPVQHLLKRRRQHKCLILKLKVLEASEGIEPPYKDLQSSA